MKCQKCGYISFDYNEICPKCNKNIAAIRDNMNLPSYKVVPLSLLGALTGEANDSGIGISVQSSEETLNMEEEVALSPEDSQAIEAMGNTFKDSEDFEIQLETTLDEGEEDLPGVDINELSLDIEDLPIEDVELDAPQTEQATEAGMVLEPEFSQSEGGDVEVTKSFDLDDLSSSESGPISEDKSQEEAEDEMTIDLEGLASALEESTEDLNGFIKSGDEKDDNAFLELEDLELDLDLDGPDSKSS